MYYRLSDISSELHDLRERGRQKGHGVGWPWELLPITLKLGSTTYNGGSPASGKTELWHEILINTSCLHGWKHALLSPETGSPADIYAELIHKFVGKPYIKGTNSMSDSDIAYASQFIDEHFVIIDPKDEDISIEEFYSIVDDIEIQTGWKIHTTTIDPWNELKENFLPEDLGREDKYLSRILKLCRKNASEKNRHNCIINHVRDQTIVKDADTGTYYYPMPHAREMAGGQVWYRKANSLNIYWRPPVDVRDSDGIPYRENELLLRVVKSKPKGVGITGVYRLFLDENDQYYIEKNGQRIYADRGKYALYKPIDGYESKPLELNTDFDDVHRGKDDLPF